MTHAFFAVLRFFRTLFCGVLSFIFACSSDLFCLPSCVCCRSLCRKLESEGSVLELKRANLVPSMADSDAAFYLQGNVKASRKRIAPMVLDCLSDFG
jgi:DHHA2 domain